MTQPNPNDIPAQVASIVAELRDKPGALLPILHAIQDRLGHIPASAIPIIAEALHQTRAEIHGVISFYHEFRTQPPGRHVMQLCRAEACQAHGSRELEAHAKQRLGIDYHHTTPDGEVTLEPVYCLGNCATGPSMRIGDRIHGRVTPTKLDKVLDQLSTVPLNIEPLAQEPPHHD